MATKRTFYSAAWLHSTILVLTTFLSPPSAHASTTGPQEDSVPQGWSKTENGDWCLTAKNGNQTTFAPGLPGIKVKNVRPLADGSDKIELDNGMVVRSRIDGSSLQFANEKAFQNGQPDTVISRNGNVRHLTWKNDSISTMQSPDGTTWYQVMPDVWSTTPKSATGWHGKLEIDGATGSFVRTAHSTTGTVVKEVFRTNGDVERHENGSLEYQIQFPDGSSRTFHFNQSFSNNTPSLQKPDKITVSTSDGKSREWTQDSSGEYQFSGHKLEIDIKVGQDGSYTFDNIDGGYYVRRLADGTELIEETQVDGARHLSVNGKTAEYELDGQKISVGYDNQGKAETIRDEQNNRLWTVAADGTWTSSVIDSSKPYAQPLDLEAKVMSHACLSPEAKHRMVLNWKNFEGKSQISAVQKASFKQSLEALLVSKPSAPFNDTERANYADQLLWHTRHLNRNEQGSNNSCNVTTLRGLLLSQQPEKVASLVAEVANTGEFVSKDGTVIKPPIDSIRPLKGSAEETFPPASGKRSALGKLWDVTTINVYYQRQTTDELGYRVGKGNVTYREVASTGKGDTGNRLVTRFSNGALRALATNTNGNIAYYDGPRMFASRIADVYYQISGDKLTDKYLIHSNRGVGDTTVFNSLVGGKIHSLAELEAVLKKHAFPVIIQGNTGILKQRYDQQKALNSGQSTTSVALGGGGEHVWLVMEYDETSRTVSIDNSWYPEYDMVSSQEAKDMGIDPKKHVPLTIDDLYKSMERTSPSSGNSSLTYTIF